MDWLDDIFKFFGVTGVGDALDKTRIPPVIVENKGKPIGRLDMEKGLTDEENIRDIISSLGGDDAVAREDALDRGPSANDYLTILGTILDREEGFSKTGYIPPIRDKKAVNKSGVTIGRGFDIGQWGEDQLVSMGIPEDILVKVRPYIGLKGQLAQQALQRAPLTLEDEELEQINNALMQHKQTDLEEFFTRVEGAKPLSANQKALLGSLKYQGISDRNYPSAFRAFKEGDYETAKKEFLGLDGKVSDWATKQTPERAWRTIEALLRDIPIEEAEEMLVKEGRISPKRRVYKK